VPNCARSSVACDAGRFPSRKLGIAVDFRDGTCTNATCHVPAHRCDHDHVIPHPAGPTTALNIDNDCRTDHRAKTHAGHQTSRPTPHTTTWTTPTGHSYRRDDPPLPVDTWPAPATTASAEAASPERRPEHRKPRRKRKRRRN
jgi:hypothetical protein